MAAAVGLDSVKKFPPRAQEGHSTFSYLDVLDRDSGSGASGADTQLTFLVLFA